MRKLTLIAAIAVLAFAGCGGDDEEPASGGSSGSSSSSSSSSGGENLAISADPSALKFDKSDLTAKAGKVTITMENPSDTPHNVVIDADGATAGKTVGKGEDSGERRPQGRRVHLLLRRRQPPRRGHGGQAHGPVRRAGTARAR